MPAELDLVRKHFQVHSQQLKEWVRTLVCRLSLSDPSHWNGSTFFPGGQPVALSFDNFAALRAEDFRVCEKTDGTRFLMLFAVVPRGMEHVRPGPTCFLVGREWDIYAIRQLLTGRNFPDQTLLDGELVIDVSRRSGRVYPRFYVFDALHYRSSPLVNRDLMKRLQAAEVIAGVYAKLLQQMDASKTGGIVQPEGTSKAQRQRSQAPLIHIVQKAMFKKTLVRGLFDKVIPRLPHRTDGVILTPRMDPYVNGTCFRILKWKPLNQNTVDFQLRVLFLKYIDATSNEKKSIQLFRLHIAERGIISMGRHSLGVAGVIPKDKADYAKLENHNGQIVEAWFDPRWHSVDYKHTGRNVGRLPVMQAVE
ncbi:hypothetical protein KIPB_004070, partial [Kipferlia bialata]|eukprot:g4070.t1